MHKLTSPEQAASYFKRDDYYLEEDGRWHGKTAALLGLKGTIKREDFVNLLNGYDKMGEKLVASAGAKDVLDANGKVKKTGHMSGLDLTFSAPKSVSILSYQDPHIQDAFKEALKETLDYAEKNYAYTQKKDKRGNVTAEKTGNLLWGTFVHTTSRELDPQLHCHCVLMNVTQDKKHPDKFKTLHNSLFYDNKMYLGLVFRTQLAEKLKNLGYTIDITDQKKGLFEIAGVGESVLGTFSKRREQVIEEMERLKKNPKYENYPEAQLAAIATINSRVAKKDVSPELVKSMVDETCESMGTSLTEIQKSAKDYKAPIVEKLPAKEFIRYAVEGLTEGQSTFSREDVLAEALKMGLGKYTVIELEAAFAVAQKNGDIAKIGERKAGVKEIYSSREMLETEQAVMQICREGKGASLTGVDKTLTEDFIARTDINLKMKSALEISEKNQEKAEAKFQKLLATVSDSAIKEKLKEVRAAALAGNADAVNYPELHQYFEKHGYGFTPGQKAALQLIASTKDQFSVIQGDAGTGKSFSCLYAKNLLEGQGFVIRGFAPTGKATTGLASAAEIEEDHKSTIDSFLISYNKAKENNGELPFTKDKEIWLVDEAGMCGSKKFLSLMNAARDANAKVVFIGDRKQFQSIEAGRMFSELQDKAGIEWVEMPDVMRQKTAQTKDIVKAISLKDMDFAFNAMAGYKKASFNKKDIKNYAVGQKIIFSESTSEIPAKEECNITAIDEGKISVEFFNDETRRMQVAVIDPTADNPDFDVLTTGDYKNMITEETDKDKCLQMVAKDYLESVSAKKDTLLITGTNKDKDMLNEIIRPELVKQGLITDSKEFTTLQTKSLGGTGAMMADSYAVGQVVKINMKSKELNFDGGEIVASSRAKNTITIREQKDGNFVDHEVDVRKYCKKISVYDKKTAEYGVGDLIIFLSNEKKKIGVNNGETAKILSIDADGTVKAKLEDGGKEVTFNLNDGHENTYKFISHAYAITDYKSQGATTSRLLWYAPTTGGPMSSNTFYVAITRCKEEVGVYTDDVEKLREMVKEGQHKESTLDYVPTAVNMSELIKAQKQGGEAAASATPESQTQKEQKHKKSTILEKIRLQLFTVEAMFANLRRSNAKNRKTESISHDI